MYKSCFKICVRCFTFNHVNYIAETLNGFCSQNTTFPFVCVIVDDASTDGEQKLILNYVYENFDLEESSLDNNEDNSNYEVIFARHKTNTNCYFAVYFLKFNHYSIKKPKLPYTLEWTNHSVYTAICEGDDYWIDPDKLQIQYDYMESHPNCTMTCHRAMLYSERKKKIVGEQYCRNSDGDLNPVDIINRTGLYIPTCSIMYRPEIRNNYPDYCQNCNVGDYPLQITAAMKGTVHYFNKIMGVYRIDNSSSFIGKQRIRSMTPARLDIVRSQLEMFKGFSKEYPQYQNVYKNKVFEHIIKNMPSWNSPNDFKMYSSEFSKELDNASCRWKLYYWVSRCPIPKIRGLYRRVFVKDYKPQKRFQNSVNY